MTRADIEAVITRRNEGWARHDSSILVADFADDAVAESPMQGRLVGKARIKEVYESWLAAFADIVFVSDDVVIDGNRVVQFFTLTGTQTGAFGGVAPTGRRFQMIGATIATVSDEVRITHERRIYDVTNLLVQLGALRTKPVTQ